MIKFLLTAWIMSIIFGPNILCSLQDRDPKCRYTVHQPGASWHTAYNVCASSNGTLPQITSLSEMYFLDLVLEEVDNLLETHSGLRISAGLWIGAFLRSSSNESMLENCDHLDSEIPVNITAVSPGDMFCLYYNRFEKTLFTENCSTAKIFICETNDEDLGECMIKSSLSTLRNQTQKQFCEDDKYDEKPISLTLCEANCLKKANCYTFTYENEVCILYKYMDNPSCARRDPLQIRKYKGIFQYSDVRYPRSEDKPLDRWCPEVTEEVIQEKITNIQKNLTINRKETSQYIRTLTSAPDERRSSKNIGIVGAFVIGAVGSFFILVDCLNFIGGIQNN